MIDRVTAQRAERLSKARVRVLLVLALIYISQQFTFFAQLQEKTQLSADDLMMVTAWVVLTLALMVSLSRFAFPFQSANVRALLDDETTRANRHQAQAFGFWTMCWSAVALYGISMYQPLTARTALHILLSASIGAALLCFARLEFEAHRSE